MSQEVTASGKKTIKDLIEGREQEFAKALQNNIDPKHFIRAALTMVQDSPKLLECTQASLYTALLKCAQLSLSPDGILGQAYLVPYGGKVQLIIGYKGLRELALRTNKYKDIRARVVYKNDKFDIQFGTDEYLKHIPAEGDRGPMRGVYAIAITTDGTALPEFMFAAEVVEHRDQYSQSYRNAEKPMYGKPAKKDSMWHTDPARAWEKTVIRRLCGRLQMSVVAQDLLIREDRIDRGLDVSDYEMEGVIDIETDGETPERTQPKQDLSEVLKKKTEKKADTVIKEVKKHVQEKPDMQTEDLKIAIDQKLTEDYPDDREGVFHAICVKQLGTLMEGQKYTLDGLKKDDLLKVWNGLK